MYSTVSRRSLRLFTALILIAGGVLGISAQDPDPNSPTPILLSEVNSTRAIALPAGELRSRDDLTVGTSRAFSLDDQVDIFVTNVSLMDGEGANAFRVYAVDKLGHTFRFPVTAFEPVSDVRGVYRVSVTLTDEVKFWDSVAADGDVHLYLTWRGLASNKVRLGIGKTGGELKDDAAMRPMPLGSNAPARPDAPDATGYRWAGDRSRFAQQAAFGPNRQLDSTLMRFGLRSWINSQFAMPYPSAGNPYPSHVLQPTNIGTNALCDGGADDSPVNCGRDSYSMYQPQSWFFREAFYGEAQLKHRVSWALSQIWVTSGNDIVQGRQMVEYHKVLSKHAFGNYRDLMKEMTLNPTMGQYLDMSISTRTSPNENYAREIMQLFSIGLFMLNQDGTLQRDAQLNPIPTYSQDEVNALTRVLTGWGFCTVVGADCPTMGNTAHMFTGSVNYIDPMIVNVGLTTNAGPNRHDIGAKTLLVYPGSGATSNIPACPTTGTDRCGLTCPATGNCTLVAGTTAAQALAGVKTYANASLDKAIDNLFYHPNVGPFVGKIMIQHMVTSDPSPAYVGRVAAAFNNNGQGVRGDMKAVIRAILLDPEARGDIKTDPNFGKLREPVQLATNFARSFGVRAASGTGQSDGVLAGGRTCGRPQFNNMAQIPFQAPTVFNYFPPDYGIPGTTLLGPEFAIMTTGTAIARATFINQMTFAANTAPATTPTAAYAIPIPVAAPDCPAGTSFDWSELVALSQADATGGQLVDELNRRMLHGSMSPAMRTAVMGALTSYTGTTALTHESRVRQAVYLVATSSQYQVQR